MNKRKKRATSIAEVIARRRNGLIDAMEWQGLAIKIAALAIAGYVLFTQVFLLTQVSGMGMFPALKDGDLMVVFRMQGDYAKNDVITCKVNGNRYVGRILARENDVVSLDQSGTLFVNGTPQSGEILYPSYAKEGLEYPYRVPEGHVFILGDYRTQTEDSRDFGPVSMDNVEGKVITILRRRGL